MAPEDQLPNIFQANLHRFYLRVVKPTMIGLAVHETLEIGEANTYDEFLDRCAAQVDNYTANEAAKAFTLMTSGLFERQLRTWAVHLFPEDGTKVRGEALMQLATKTAVKAGFDIDSFSMQRDLREAYMVANIVRHGDGRTLNELMTDQPSLWDDRGVPYIDLLSTTSPASEMIQIKLDDLNRYVLAGLRFWGHSSKVPFAQKDPAL